MPGDRIYGRLIVEMAEALSSMEAAAGWRGCVGRAGVSGDCSVTLTLFAYEMFEERLLDRVVGEHQERRRDFETQGLAASDEAFRWEERSRAKHAVFKTRRQHQALRRLPAKSAFNRGVAF
jgi:hypothetical protein